MNNRIFATLSILCLQSVLACARGSAHRYEIASTHIVLDLSTGIQKDGRRYFAIHVKNNGIDHFEIIADDQESPLWQIEAIEPAFSPERFVYAERFAPEAAKEVVPPHPLLKGKEYLLRVCIAGSCDGLKFRH